MNQEQAGPEQHSEDFWKRRILPINRFDRGLGGPNRYICRPLLRGTWHREWSIVRDLGPRFEAITI